MIGGNRLRTSGPVRVSARARRIVLVVLAMLALAPALSLAAVAGGTYRGRTSQHRAPSGGAMFIKVKRGRIVEVNFGFDAGGVLCEEGDFDTGAKFSLGIGRRGGFRFSRYGFAVQGRFLTKGKVTGSFKQKPFRRNGRRCGTGKVTFSLHRT